MQKTTNVLAQTGGEADLSPTKFILILALILVLNQAFYLLTGKTHLYIFNALVGDGNNRYTLDFTLTVFKNILIIVWQLFLIVSGLRLFKISASDIGWRKSRDLWKILAGIAFVLTYRILKEVFAGNNVHGGTAISLSSFWGMLDNPVVYYHLIIVPFVSPLFEELFYRGIIFTALERRHGWFYAVIGSALFFSAFHTTKIISFSLELFFKGVIYGLLRKWDGSIWSSVCAHSMNNLLSAWFIIRV